MNIDDLKSIKDYPDISFIENYTVEKLEADMVGWFREKRKEITGEEITLSDADDRKIILQTGAYFIFHGYMYLDNAGKMGLLKYSRGEFLENLGALKHIYRKEATKATTTVRFHVNQARNVATGIPEGTRITAGDGLYFATDTYAEIKSGEMYVDTVATCTIAGEAGNVYGIGELSTIVDPVAFIDTVENITAPRNGADIESDESLKQRIYIAPAAYSAAGTSDAYTYFVKEFNPDISDVKIISPEPCIVVVRYLLKEGEIPQEESINALQEYLSRPSIKPVTDKIQVMAPDLVNYQINLKYFINASDRNQANVIQGKVQEAVSNYVIWQKSKMGRDINPSELMRRIMTAGAKRAEINQPVFTVVADEAVASVQKQTLIYGGLEDD